MKDLLERWAEQEPERCEKDAKSDYFYVMRWGTMRKTSLIARLDEDRIQGAVQEAIDARGWSWHVGKVDDAYNGVVWYGDPADWTIGSVNDSPAAALLSAYLEAISMEHN